MRNMGNYWTMIIQRTEDKIAFRAVATFRGVITETPTTSPTQKTQKTSQKSNKRRTQKREASKQIIADEYSQKETLNTAEAVAYLGISRRHLYTLTMNRVIPHTQPAGKMMYFKRADLDAYMNRNPVATMGEIEGRAKQ